MRSFERDTCNKGGVGTSVLLASWTEQGAIH